MLANSSQELVKQEFQAATFVLEQPASPLSAFWFEFQ